MKKLLSPSSFFSLSFFFSILPNLSANGSELKNSTSSISEEIPCSQSSSTENVTQNKETSREMIKSSDSQNSHPNLPLEIKLGSTNAKGDIDLKIEIFSNLQKLAKDENTRIKVLFRLSNCALEGDYILDSSIKKNSISYNINDKIESCKFSLNQIDYNDIPNNIFLTYFPHVENLFSIDKYDKTNSVTITNEIYADTDTPLFNSLEITFIKFKAKSTSPIIKINLNELSQFKFRAYNSFQSIANFIFNRYSLFVGLPFLIGGTFARDMIYTKVKNSAQIVLPQIANLKSKIVRPNSLALLSMGVVGAFMYIIPTGLFVNVWNGIQAFDFIYKKTTTNLPSNTNNQIPSDKKDDISEVKPDESLMDQGFTNANRKLSQTTIAPPIVGHSSNPINSEVLPTRFSPSHDQFYGSNTESDQDLDSNLFTNCMPDEEPENVRLVSASLSHSGINVARVFRVVSISDSGSSLREDNVRSQYYRSRFAKKKLYIKRSKSDTTLVSKLKKKEKLG